MSDTTPPDGAEEEKPDKPLFFIASSLRDLTEFPHQVKRVIGFALRQAQQGGRHDDAKPLRGLGGGVLEVVVDHDTNSFRGVYTVTLEGAVYVLHAFQKKSKAGRKTPKPEMDLVARRLKAAEEHHERWKASRES